MNKYSHLSKEELLELIEKQDSELGLKKYGLAWDHEKEPEKVVIDCKNNLPILKKVSNKAVYTNNKEDNLIIEGDNYHALQVLNYTHKDKVDMIYIDPPYNTGKQDFIYNDKYVDEEDGYRHSKWLNFMYKRLDLARNLLRDDGVIFISIDDNEQANLKLLCDKVFGEKNKIGILPTVMNLKGNNDEFGFAGTHEYSFVYAKNKSLCTINQFNLVDEDDLNKWEEDYIGFYKKGATLKATGEDAKREKRPKMFYPILYKEGVVSTIDDAEYKLIYNIEDKTFDDEYVLKLKEKYEKRGFVFILPKNDNIFTRWRWGWGQETKRKLRTDVIALETKNGISLYKKQRPELGDLPTKKPKSLFYKPEYSSGNGTGLLKNMFGDKVFNNPKPMELIKDFIVLGGKKNSLILDFMAGSGTTGHAVLELNKEDDGTRKFILCTNNENGIAEEVCYPRVKKVIEGYQTQDKKKENILGLGGNLQYFKTDFVDNTKNDDQIRWALTNNCTDMLCVRENIFNLLKEDNDFKIFKSNDNEKFLCIYYNFIENSFDEFVDEVKNLKGKKSVYVFSLDDSIDREPFKDIVDCEFEPIPQNILDLYKRIRKDHIKVDKKDGEK